MSAIFETWNRGQNISELVDILRNFSFAATIFNKNCVEEFPNVLVNEP